MNQSAFAGAPRFRPYTSKHIDEIASRFGIDAERALTMKAVSHVLPFRTNAYALEELIDWDRVPDDPIYQLTIPQAGMLEPSDLARMKSLVREGAPSSILGTEARRIQNRLNPHPAGQMKLNVPELDGRPLPGMQHKYRETVLFFPAQGQTCHAYCTYCFRWAQFVGIDDLRFNEKDPELLVEYLRRHPEVQNVLFTGGDPMVMKARALGGYVDALLDAELDSLQSIRIGSKSLAYWPHRFLTDPDADDVLRLFERVARSGVHLAFMAHASHPRELETPAARAAVARILETGASIRHQAPLIRHVNDDARVWADLWSAQVRSGGIPYYLFIQRDTGPRSYFEVPLARAHDIFSEAYASVSGLARTVRGPSMSATPGKVLVDGVARVHGEKVFVLKMLQGRDPAWVNRVFFAQYDRNATWLDELKPAFGQRRFFFEENDAPRLRARLPMYRAGAEATAAE